MSQILSVKQVHQYFGGNIGRDKIYKLMKANVIQSAWIGTKLVASRESVEDFSKAIFDNGVNLADVLIVPVSKINSFFSK